MQMQHTSTDLVVGRDSISSLDFLFLTIATRGSRVGAPNRGRVGPRTSDLDLFCRRSKASSVVTVDGIVQIRHRQRAQSGGLVAFLVYIYCQETPGQHFGGNMARTLYPRRHSI